MTDRDAVSARSLSDLLAIIWHEEAQDSIDATSARAEILRRVRTERERTLKRFNRLGAVQSKHVRRMRRVGFAVIVAGGYMGLNSVVGVGFLFVARPSAASLGQFSFADMAFWPCAAALVALWGYLAFALIYAGVGFLDGREDARRRLVRALGVLSIFGVPFVVVAWASAIDVVPSYRPDISTVAACMCVIALTAAVIWWLRDQLRLLRSYEARAWCLAHSFDHRDTSSGSGHD